MDPPAGHESRAARLDRVMRRFDWPMAVLAIAVVPAILVEQRATSAAVQTGALVVNWIIWVAFCVEFGVGLVLAPERLAFVRRSWFDLAIIVVSPPVVVPDAFQSARTLRALRLLRLLRALAVLSIGVRMGRRALGHRKFHYVAFMAGITVALGALGIYVVESAQNDKIGSLADALWWAVVTATTVGYGDVSPVTLEARAIAVVLMLTGIGGIGVFTATIASSFFDQEADEDRDRIEVRLDRIERQLDRLAAMAEEERSGRVRRH